MVKYKRVSFRCSREFKDLVSDFLLGLDAVMVAAEETQDGWIGISADFAEETSVGGVVERLKGYAAFLDENVGASGIEGIEVEDVDPESWQLWREGLKPVRVGRRVVVRPPWEPFKPEGEDIVIEINPSMSFGTGHHETTALCVGFIEDEVESRPVRSMLDVGCGSGILCVAAVKLGVGEATGIDTDPVAVREARENAERNFVGGEIRVVHGSIEGVGGVYDLIAANMTLEAIVKMAQRILERLAPGGRLIASGIPAARKDEALAGLGRAGFTPIGVRVDGEWVGLLFGVEGARAGRVV